MTSGDTDSLAAKETKRINVLRIVTLVLLVTLAALASIGVFIHSKNSDKRKFEADFAINSRLIVDAFLHGVNDKLGKDCSDADA